MPKINLKNLLLGSGKKLLHPIRFWRYMQAAKERKKIRTVADNAQLQLYSKILPGDFLHYGYFDDPATPPEEISLAGFYRAQLRYAELLIEQSAGKAQPVLDAGCGLGGLVQVLLDKEYKPVALTPDRFQIEYLQKKYADTQLLHMKFEDLPVDQFNDHFGTVIHSESIQYMELDKVVSIVQQIMNPDGKWVICDYFRTGQAVEQSGLRWDPFLKTLEDNGFQVDYQRDITENIQPTLAYIHMLGNKIGVPVVDFVTHKIEKKKPGIYYFLQETLAAGRESLLKQLEKVDPQIFSASKRYMLLTVSRK